MAPNHQIFSKFPVSNQNIIIEGFSSFDQDIEQILDYDESIKSVNRGKNIAKQTVYFLILSALFGKELGVIHSIISSDRAPLIKERLESLFKRVISYSWVYKNAPDMLNLHSTSLENLFSKFQDYYYTKIGDTARIVCSNIFTTSNQKITVPIECFIGIIPPSVIFPKHDTYSRGELMAHLNARIYQHINHISSITELDGKLKTVSFIDNRLCFDIAGRLGFVNRPPGIKKLYWYSDYLESNLQIYEKAIDKLLIKENIQDLSVNSIDGCNLSVDCRNLEASNGTGSRGFFLDIKHQ
ncbi:MAG: hypothetical protein K9W44_14350 [Candidatus Lokiarchaeota archaeon]|nr:hypothetical protein [Candidatus Harpocratesius repetitus]